MKKYIFILSIISLLLTNGIIGAISKPVDTNIVLKLVGDNTASYADFNGIIFGSLIRGSSSNNVQIQLTPFFFNNYTFLGRVYTIIDVKLSNIQLSYHEYDSSNNQIGGQYGSTIFTNSDFGLDQQHTFTFSNISIDTNALTIHATVTINGELEQELNNDPNNTSYISATGITDNSSIIQTEVPGNNNIGILAGITVLIGIGITAVGGLLYMRTKSNK